MTSQAGNVNTIKNGNRSLIFRYIRKAPISRAEISKQSGMSKSAVTMITNALIEEGQLCEIGQSDSACGRKPILLDIVADYRYAGGIALHRKQTGVYITDLKSNIVAFCSIRTERFDTPIQVLDWACNMLLKLAEEKQIPREKLIGVGISAPGPVDYKEGVILTPPNFEMFHHIPVAEYVEKKLGLPVMVDNNAVLLAMQEYILLTKQSLNAMVIIVSDGIGSAIITRGKVYRGHSGYAGEIGHTSIDLEGIPCECGNQGCLEQYVSMKALKARFEFDSYERLVDNAYIGDRTSLEVIDFIAKCLSAAMVNAINFFDLDRVILCGDFAYRNELLLQKIRQRVGGMSIIGRVHEVEVAFSTLPPEKSNASVTAAILGAYFNHMLD
ncbi:MAG: ROK family transcriptional regulator [Clostridia bacterium]|nr:ROK family transcriptional regulator [Clostridia bacterium]